CKAITGCPLGSGELGKVLFLLFLRAIIQNRQGADTCMGSIGGGKGSSTANDIRNKHGGVETHTQATVLFRYGYPQQAHLPCLTQDARNKIRILHTIYFLCKWHDF